MNEARSRHRRSRRSGRVDRHRRRRADGARARAARRHGHREDAGSDQRVDRRAARLRAAREPRLRRLGPPLRRTSTRARCTTRCSRPTSSRQVKEQLETIRPWPAVFAKTTRRTLEGENVVARRTSASRSRSSRRTSTSSSEARPRSRRDGEPRVDGARPRGGAGPRDARGVRGGARRERPGHHAGDALLLRGEQARHPVLQLHAEPHQRPGARRARATRRATRSPAWTARPARRSSRRRSPSMFRVRRLHIEGWYSTNILGNNDGLVLDDPELEQDQGALEGRACSTRSSATTSRTTRSTSTTTSRAATRKRPGTTSTSSASPACRCR